MNITKIYALYPEDVDCRNHLELVRWNLGATCPYCKAKNRSTRLPKEQRYHCNNCNTSYSITVGTIFHHTHLPLQKWFLAVSLILNAKKGISARQLSRDIEVNKDTAWRIAMKIREAMREGWQRELLSGIVEVDETYVGGKPRPGEIREEPRKRGRGTDKIPVVGMVQRQGKVKAQVVKKDALTSDKLSALVRKNVDIKNSKLITDEFRGYCGIKLFMPHETINHSICYSIGDIHTNNIESFWALLKRGIVGQFHKVSLKYLPRYLDEFCYRYNNRKAINDDVFCLTIAKGLGVIQ